MGGKAAMQLALTVPHRVSQLIVVDIAPITYIPTPHPADPSIVLRAMRNVDFSVAKSRKDVDTHLLEGGLSSEQVRHFVMTNLVKSDTVDQRYRWKLNLPAISDSYRQIASFPNHEGNVYNGPTCMIRGGKSSYVPFHAMKNFTALFPNTKLVTISEAGHWLQSQNPDDFVRSVNDFLSD